MKYLGKSFSVHPGSEKAYRDNYDAVFGKKRGKSITSVVPSAKKPKWQQVSDRRRIAPDPRDPEEP